MRKLVWLYVLVRHQGAIVCGVNRGRMIADMLRQGWKLDFLGTPICVDRDLNRWTNDLPSWDNPMAPDAMDGSFV